MSEQFQVGGGTRRDFIKSSTAAAIGGALAANLSIARSAHAAGSEQIKLALIGCGGRGTGAASQALHTEGDVKLVAMADMFPDRLNTSYQTLNTDELKTRIDVPHDRKFTGFDAYQKAINSGVDMVILATPPGFRPIHFEAAIKAGKHVFMEKPVATDAAGVRKVLAATEEAKRKNLGVGVGLQRRHQPHYIDLIKRIHDGELGDIIAMRAYWNGRTPWQRKREDLEKQKGGKLTEMEYQLRNWYYFTWICGDHIVEQHIHNMDVINWVKNGYPVRANGMGGCEVRKGLDYGETFDHHSVEFEYADGSRFFSQCRHIPGCFDSVSEHVHGTLGSINMNDRSAEIKIVGKSEAERIRSQGKTPYQVEHDELFASIRAGKPLNEGEYGANSTMTAILGRMCTYSGKVIEWKDAINSQVSIMPEEFSLEATPPVLPGADGLYPRAVPGVTKVL